ncbi:MAG: hypothetical protein U0936_14285 [Planctomycetaceae bacterium]
MSFKRMKYPWLSLKPTLLKAVLHGLLLLTSVMSYATPAEGQTPSPNARSFRDRVVDKISLNDNTQIWGLLLGRKPTRLLVNTTWMRTNAAEFYEKDVLPCIKESKTTPYASLAENLQKEIDLAKAAVPEEPQRIGLLKEILARLTPDEVDEPGFIVLELPKSRVTNIESQSEARRELCRLALLNDLQDIEETHWKSIAQQLQAIPAANRKLTAPLATNNDEENLEKILAAVDLRTNSASRLIQTGSTVLDESTKPDLSLLLNSMLGGNVQSLVGELLNEGLPRQQQAPPDDTLPAAAGRIADSNKHSTVVLSGFEFDVTSGSATVTRRLFRKGNNGQWRLLLSSGETSTAADVKPGQVEAIENDPQVKEIAGLVEGLGLGGGQFSNALQMGAVVQNALGEANQKFEESIQDIITVGNLARAQESPVIVLPDSRAR